MSEPKPKGNLYLIPVTLAAGMEKESLPAQVFEVLGKTDLYLAENIRTARRFISTLKLGIDIERLRFELLDKHTQAKQVKAYLQSAMEGKHIGVLSEAGCPGIADPGAVAVAIAHQLGIRVVPITGPSSILLALMASGFSGQAFSFHGYLPIDKAARAQQIKKLETLVKADGSSHLFMETPYRNNALLDTLLSTCHPHTQLCIAANLTSNTEFVQTHSIKTWQKQIPDLHKIPTIFILGEHAPLPEK